MAQKKAVPDEFDTDEVKAINQYISKAPQYFEKTDKIFSKVFGNGVPGMDEDIRNVQKSVDEILGILKISDPVTTKRKMDDMFAMARAVTISVIIFLVTSALGGVIFLIRYAPYLTDLEKIVKATPHP